MKKVSVLEVPIEFHCSECAGVAQVTPMFLYESGTPVCGACDTEMFISNYQLAVWTHEAGDP